MQDLRARLINGGFPDISFRIIISNSNKRSDESLHSLQHSAGDIPVIEETEIIPSWQYILEGEVDHILVLDRCGRLAFQVISPWSLLNYPYVKASILSTYKDEPCGPCSSSATSKEQAVYISMHDVINENNVDSSTSYTTETVDVIEKQTIEHNILTTPLYTPHFQSEIVDNEESNGKNILELEHDSINKTEENILQNNLDINKSEREELSSFSEHRNLEVTEKTRPYSYVPSETQQEPLTTTEDNKMEVEKINQGNELDATLHPLIERKDGTIPIRMIMHFPHTHYKNGKFSEHEYVVLQTGNPEYHGHLESEENQDLEPPENNDRKSHILEENKLQNRNRNHDSRKQIEHQTTDDHHIIEDENTEDHKQKKNKLQLKHRESDEKVQENKEDKKSRIKNKNMKIKIRKPYPMVNHDNEEKSMDVNNTWVIKIYNETNTTITEKPEEIVEEAYKEDKPQYNILSTTEMQENIGNVSNEDEHHDFNNSETKAANEEDHSSAEISEETEKLGKHHSENVSLNLNMTEDENKPDLYNNENKIMRPLKTVVNGTNMKNNTKKLKVHKILHMGMETNNTESHRSENSTSQFIKKNEIQKKKIHNKKLKVSVFEASNTSTLAPLPTISDNIDKVNESKPVQTNKNSMKGKFKSVLKNVYNTHKNKNKQEKPKSMQRLQQVDVFSNLEKPNSTNKTQDDMLSEENNSEGMDDNIINHYSKLLKWIDYDL